MSIHMSIHMFIRMSICMSIHLSFLYTCLCTGTFYPDFTYDELYRFRCGDWSRCSLTCNNDWPLAASTRSRSCDCLNVYAGNAVPNERCQGLIPMVEVLGCKDLPHCPPVVTNIVPLMWVPGGTLTLIGRNFGEAASDLGDISLGGTQCITSTWRSSIMALCTMPAFGTSDDVQSTAVTVSVRGTPAIVNSTGDEDGKTSGHFVAPAMTVTIDRQTPNIAGLSTIKLEWKSVDHIQWYQPMYRRKKAPGESWPDSTTPPTISPTSALPTPLPTLYPRFTSVPTYGDAAIDDLRRRTNHDRSIRDVDRSRSDVEGLRRRQWPTAAGAPARSAPAYCIVDGVIETQSEVLHHISSLPLTPLPGTPKPNPAPPLPIKAKSSN